MTAEIAGIIGQVVFMVCMAAVLIAAIKSMG